MQGIVSLLDDPYAQIVHDIWDELKTKCGIAGTQVPQFPHFSYHVAGRYDETLRPLLKKIAAGQKTFKVNTAGLGIFNGGNPVVFVSLVRDSALSQFHESIYPVLSSTTTTSLAYYEPRMWMPHITLAQGDLTPQNLPDVIRVLNDRDFDWEISINNLTWLSETNVITRYDF